MAILGGNHPEDPEEVARQKRIQHIVETSVVLEISSEQIEAQRASIVVEDAKGNIDRY